jgi:chemotaxis signal transduction protein
VSGAGVSDAGVSDAGVSDAGVSDAGVSDAGVSDAGPPASLVLDFALMSGPQHSISLPPEAATPGESAETTLSVAPTEPEQTEAVGFDFEPPAPVFAAPQAFSVLEPVAPPAQAVEASIDEPELPMFLASPVAPAALVETPIPEDLVPPLPAVLAESNSGGFALPPMPTVPPADETRNPAPPLESRAARRHLESLVGALDVEINEGLANLNAQVGLSRPLGLSSTSRQRSTDANSERFVVFHMSGTRYGLPIGEVLEMANVPRTTPLPNAPDFIRGVANMRGEVLAVIDLRVLLALETAGELLRERMIVVRSPQSDAVAGLIVDSVRGLARLSAGEIVQPSSPVEDRVSDFLQGVASHEDQVLNVLDTRKLFSAPEMLALAAV